MTALRALLCYLNLHQPRPGVDVEWAIAWVCDHCGCLRDGGLRRRP